MTQKSLFDEPAPKPNTKTPTSASAIKANIDGGARGNPGPSAYGVVVRNGAGEIIAELSDYLDEQLDDSLCEELEKHLSSCEPCKAFLASLEATIEQCQLLPEADLDSKKARELRRKILTDYEKMVAQNTAG